MKSEGAVRHQLKQVVFRHLKRQLRENFRAAPETCHYNKAVNIPGGGQVRLCYYKDDLTDAPRKIVCDSEILDGVEQAENCPYWKPLRTKEAIKSEFQDLIAHGDRGHIAASYPDIAALLWVLDSDEDQLSLESFIKEEGQCEQSFDDNPIPIPSNVGESKSDPVSDSGSSPEGDEPLPSDKD